MNKSILKKVIGLCGDIFEINCDGTEVYTIERISHKTNKLIKRRKKSIFLASPGYYAVNYIDPETNKKGPVHVHRLVCQAWNGPFSENNNYCRHIDDNRLNNHFGNLEWGSQSENMKDAIANKKFKLGIQRKDCKLTDDDIFNIINDSRTCSQISKDYNVGVGHISAIKLRKERKYLDTNIESDNYGKK